MFSKQNLVSESVKEKGMENADNYCTIELVMSLSRPLLSIKNKTNFQKNKENQLDQVDYQIVLILTLLKFRAYLEGNSCNCGKYCFLHAPKGNIHGKVW